MTDTIEQFDYDINVFSALLWQYENAPNVNTLILNKNVWLGFYYSNFWLAWYFNVFNLQTVNIFGATVWSIILDLPLFVPLTPPVPGNFWGFNDPSLLNGYQNFENGNFAAGDIAPTLTLEEQIQCLQLRYYQCVSRGAVTEVNAFLDYVFGALGGCYMIDNLDMTIEYHFGYNISTELIKVIEDNLLLPKPAGVSIEYFDPSGPIG